MEFNNCSKEQKYNSLQHFMTWNVVYSIEMLEFTNQGAAGLL